MLTLALKLGLGFELGLGFGCLWLQLTPSCEAKSSGNIDGVNGSSELLGCGLNSSP
jgi:hypothetical protein